MTQRSHPVVSDETAASLWIVLARAYHSLAKFLESSIAGMDICLSDFMILEVLLHKGPLSMGEIAGKVLLADASMTSATNRLEQRGLVSREPQLGDRRVRVVALTTVGRALIRRLYVQHEKHIEQAMDEIAPSERVHLRSSLKKIGLRASMLTTGNEPKQTEERKP